MRWILLAVSALVALVCAPIVVTPQLDPDDYRYLDLVQQLRAGQLSWVRAAIIENRWDHLWWIDCEQAVRFFRPTLILSYFADDVVHGGSPRGMLVTNWLLYWTTCVLAALFLARVVYDTLAVALASLLFAGMAAHAECIWYIAGRNETLAATAFLAGLVLHGAAGRVRYLALPCYALALASKELTLPLPLLALAYDRFARRRAPSLAGCVRRDLRLYAGYAVCAAVYLTVRHLVLSAAGGSDLVFPYFVSPSRPDFAQHLWQQVMTYGDNLFAGGITTPFLRADQFAERTSTVGKVLTCVLPLVALVQLRREPRALLFSLLALTTWLPAAVVYVSERYLFLPSLGVAGLAALIVARAPGRTRFVCAAVVALWGAHQTSWLLHKNKNISQTPHDMAGIERHLRRVAPALPPERPIYVLNLPTDTFGAQFFAHAMRVVLRDPTRPCHVLTLVPEDRSWLQTSSFVRTGPQTLEVRGAPVLMGHSRWLFPWTPLAAGTRVTRARLPFTAEVRDGAIDHCRAVRFSLPHALDDAVFLRFTLPPSSVPLPRGELIARGQLDVIKP